MSARQTEGYLDYLLRSTVVGLVIGSLMCFSNMYFSLQTGCISMMSLQASLLGFAIFKPCHVSFGPKENVYLQTVAVATATMPLAAGFVGIVPALSQLTTSDLSTGPLKLPAWKLIVWSLGLAFTGVFFAIPLRKQTIIREKLRFPSEQHENLLQVNLDTGWEESNSPENIDVIPEEDLPQDRQVPIYVAVLGLLGSIILCVTIVKIVFGSNMMPAWMTVVSVVLAMFLSILSARALGETDLNPVSGISKLSQIAASALIPGAIVANLFAGGIAEASAQQAGDLMQDLKTGYLLHASPKAQFYGQLVGSLVSSFVATGAYLLYTSVYEIPGPEFPAPTAQFVVAFAVLFFILTVVKENKKVTWHQWVPQGIAFAIGIYSPPSFTLAKVVGGFICHYWEKFINGDQTTPNKAWLMDVCKPYKKIGKVSIIIIASRFVLGEGTFAVVSILLHALHFPHI
ncbi:OPT oligopeptide transporter protein-domain-containing protein [Parasitella parasitica]|nr:OPT oligopeptide transporter protein-domain-containing protein [Parasitella parasitica]